jgi:RNA polymerase sigma factor (TIGR02999 family)
MDSRSAQPLPENLEIDALSGDIEQSALDTIFSATYEELRRLAAAVRRSDAHATLSPTTLVNEAWLKLSRNPPPGFESKLHFKRVAARAMRQVLVEAARKKSAVRHGGMALLVTLDEGSDQASADASGLIALDEALKGLSRINARQASMIEARFFGGLDVAETAELLGVSEATILRDWRAAKAWLSLQLRAT